MRWPAAGCDVAQQVDAPAGTHALGGAAAGEDRARPHRRRPRPARIASPGRVLEIGYLGDMSIYKVQLDNGLVLKAAGRPTAAGSVERPIARGDRVWLSWPADAGVVLTR